jgi:myo-inositol 2-dehydrogenase/D-chiro-inositol 1-dehydrogenase
MVGAGQIAHVHATTLAATEGAEVVGFHDVVAPRAAAMAEAFGAGAAGAGASGARPFGSLPELLAEVDAVCVCTMPQFHREAVEAAAAAGKHVFCEKPLAASVEDALAMQAAVERAGITCMMGFNFRFSPATVRLKELVESGQLGAPHSYYAIRALWLPHEPPNWRTDPRFIVGMTIESLSHDFDYMRWVVGDAVSAMGRVATTRPDLVGYDNVTSAILSLANGGMASFHQTWASHVAVNRFGVVGSLGSASMDWGPVRWRRDGDTQDRIIPVDDRPEDHVSSHELEMRHFVACLRDGRAPLTNVRDGVATVRISHAVLESSRTGASVAIA